MIIHQEGKDKKCERYSPQELTKNFQELESQLDRLDHTIENFSELLDNIMGEIALKLKHKK